MINFFAPTFLNDNSGYLLNICRQMIYPICLEIKAGLLYAYSAMNIYHIISCQTNRFEVALAIRLVLNFTTVPTLETRDEPRSKR